MVNSDAHILQAKFDFQLHLLSAVEMPLNGEHAVIDSSRSDLKPALSIPISCLPAICEFSASFKESQI